MYIYNDIVWFVCYSCMFPVLSQVGNKCLTAWMFWSEMHVEAKIYSRTDIFWTPDFKGLSTVATVPDQSNKTCWRWDSFY